MTHMSIQNMNGVGTLMRRRISSAGRLTLNDIVPPDGTPTSEDDLGLDPKGLSPNYAPWWVQPRLKSDEVTTQRGTPTPGETRKAYSADHPAFPMTPSNDARDLPNSYTGKPLRQLPRRNYPGDFPHTWIPYEDLQNATGPEMGPTQPGYAPIPSEAQMRARASDGGAPVPWVAEDHMTHDISGFSSLSQLGQNGWLRHVMGQRVRGRMVAHLKGMGDIPGMVVDLDAPAPAAAVNAVTNQAVTAAAAGASPDTITQIIDFGSKAATLALQASGAIPKPATTSILPAALTSSAATPVIIMGGAAALLGAVLLAMKGGKKGRRR
jgi:hypothetical protein